MSSIKTGARKNTRTPNKKPLPRTRKSTKSKLSKSAKSIKSIKSKKSNKSTKSNKSANVPRLAIDHHHIHPPLPKTANIMSRKSTPRVRRSYADSTMSLTDLQFMAKSAGIPFGGLSRTNLIRKINAYR